MSTDPVTGIHTVGVPWLNEKQVREIVRQELAEIEREHAPGRIKDLEGLVPIERVRTVTDHSKYDSAFRQWRRALKDKFA